MRRGRGRRLGDRGAVLALVLLMAVTVASSGMDPPAGAAEPGASFVPLGPARVLDTRADGPTVDGLGPKGALGPGASHVIPLSGRAGLPTSGVSAVVLNVTATGATGPTYLTVWPTTSPRPLTSNLNPSGPQPLANVTTVRMGANGSVSLYNAAGLTDVIADLTGYYVDGGGYVATDPLRFADTRAGEPTIDGGGPRGAVGPAQTIHVPVAGRSGIPADATAVIANLTATNATAPTYLTVWPAGTWRPLASNLNPSGGTPVSNLVTTAMGADGAVAVFNAVGSVDVIVDIAGYFANGSDYHPLSPARLLDTRPGGSVVEPGLPGGWYASGLPRADSETILRVTGRAGIPASGVGAVILNVTVVDAWGPTFTTVWPTGSPRPWTSNLNPIDGQPVANQVVAKVGLTGSVSLYNAAGSVNYVVDVVGWLPAVPGDVPFGGALGTPSRTFTPALSAGETVRYHLPLTVGEAISVAASPFPVGGAGVRCDATLTVRRPDLSVRGEARVDCAGTSVDRSLDIDLVADQSGIWLVDVHSDLDRSLPSFELVVSPFLNAGAAPLDTRITVPDLEMGQNVGYSISPQPGRPLTIGVRPSRAESYDVCDITVTVLAPDATPVEQAEAALADCTGNFSLPNSLRVEVPNPTGGTYHIIVDSGGPSPHRGMSLIATQPMDLGALAVPTSFNQPLAAGQRGQWTLHLDAGQNVNLNVRVGRVNGCASYALRRPDGSVEASSENCGPGFGAVEAGLPALLQFTAAQAGAWSLSVANDSNGDTSATGSVSVDLVGPPIARDGDTGPTPALQPGQSYLRPVELSVGDQLQIVASYPGEACPPSVTWVLPSGARPTHGFCGTGRPTNITVQEAGTWWIGVEQSRWARAVGPGSLTFTFV